MASATDFAEAAIAEHVLSGEALTLPAAWHVALFTVAPGESSSGTEVTGSGYARVAVTRNTTNFPDGVMPVVNAAAVTFPTATSDYSADVVAVGLFDASSGGNLWFYDALASAKTIEDGDTPEIAAGDLSLNVD